MSDTISLKRAASIAGLMLAGVVILGSTAAAAEAPPDLAKVTLRVGDQTGATQSKLQAAHLLDGLPYKIEWSVYAAAVNLHEALKADAVDTGLAGDAPTVSAIAGGSPIQVVAAFHNSSPGTSIVVQKDSAIASLADLRGKTISPTTRGSAGHFLVLKALAKAGIPLSDVKLAFLNPADANAAFQTHTIDAWSIWGIYRARAQGALQGRTIASAQTLTHSLFVLAATRNSIADAGKRAALADFANRVDRGYIWAHDNREALIEWYTGFTKLDRETAAALYEEEGSYTRVPTDDRLADQLQDIFATWVQGGVLKGDVDVRAAVYRTLQAD